ncbi:hypothetical protein [uncultured Maribacter sp.]|uniref:hypothetical protein n=1 Tax=uncultured Maribacter sp. TaxID=431308 RepID=UPI0026078CBC|nr:hypothetical protein [uncultured Maribacter sp.]
MVTTKTLDILDAEYTTIVKKYKELEDNLRYKNSEETFILDPIYWEKYQNEIDALNCVLDWKEFKFDSKPNLETLIPTNEIGIYMFTVKPNNLIYDFPKYVIYVGISGEKGSNRPLKERLNDYFNFNEIKKRKKLHRLLSKYFKNTHVAYSTVNITWQNLEKLEKAFHGFFLPIGNSRDFPVDIKTIKDAF